MPWTISDVESHKVGLTPKQKAKWVKLANAILKDCMEMKQGEKVCAPKAIRIANSKVSKSK